MTADIVSLSMLLAVSIFASLSTTTPLPLPLLPTMVGASEVWC
jgi:hypothetical protein